MRPLFKLTLRQKRSLAGYIGGTVYHWFIFFFLAPMLQSFRFSVSELIFTTEGYELSMLACRISSMR